jgi:formylmethanofuran dehydrogenase subunit A|tara:strand:+ start:1712 stop:2083 length:372 start_codon:yes stop_codon:yes gene_type:complete
MPKVCILNATTNVVENVVVVDDVNNVPSFVIKEGQVLATDHTGEIDDTWNGSAYVPEAFVDNRTDDEKWSDIREKRNDLLAETDFYALSDVTMSTEMTTYRQSLRDLPSTQSDPDNITWPTKP